MTNGLAHWLTILTPLIVLAGQLYARRDRNKKQETNLEKTAEVHTLVNGQSEAAASEIKQLTATVATQTAKIDHLESVVTLRQNPRGPNE